MGNLGRWVLVALCSVALFAAGCGDDEDSGSSDSSSASTSAADSGGEIKVDKKTIGFLDIALSSPVGRATEAAVKAAGDELGWEVITEDGEANPETMAPGRELVRHAQRRRGHPRLRRGRRDRRAAAPARREGHPGDRRQRAGRAEPADRLPVHRVRGRARPHARRVHRRGEPEAKIGNIKSTLSIAGTSATRRSRRSSTRAARRKILADVEPDFASLVPSTTKGVTDMLTAHPRHRHGRSPCSTTSSSPTIAAMRSKESDAKLYTFYLTPTSFKPAAGREVAARRRSSTRTSTTPAWSRWTSSSTISRTARALDPDAIKKDPVKYTVVTRDNLPASLDDASKTEAALAPFREKWQKEFGG